MSACKSCGAPILWARTISGNLMPVSRDPVPNGNVLIECGVEGEYRALVMSANEIAAWRDQDNPLDLHISHFAACPQATRHRRKNGDRNSPSV